MKKILLSVLSITTFDLVSFYKAFISTIGDKTIDDTFNLDVSPVAAEFASVTKASIKSK